MEELARMQEAVQKALQEAQQTQVANPPAATSRTPLHRYQTEARRACRWRKDLGSRRGAARHRDPDPEERNVPEGG